MVHFRERYVYWALLVLSMAVFWFIPSQIQAGAARIAPYISAVIILGCSIACLVRCMKGNEKVVSFSKDVLLLLSLSILIFGIYVFMMDIAGYFVMSAVFILVMLWMLEIRSIAKLVLISILVPLSIYMLLVKLLHLIFPSGYFI